MYTILKKIHSCLASRFCVQRCWHIAMVTQRNKRWYRLGMSKPGIGFSYLQSWSSSLSTHGLSKLCWVLPRVSQKSQDVLYQNVKQEWPWQWFKELIDCLQCFDDRQWKRLLAAHDIQPMLGLHACTFPVFVINNGGQCKGLINSASHEGSYGPTIQCPPMFVEN